MTLHRKFQTKANIHMIMCTGVVKCQVTHIDIRRHSIESSPSAVHERRGDARASNCTSHLATWAGGDPTNGQPSKCGDQQKTFTCAQVQINPSCCTTQPQPITADTFLFGIISPIATMYYVYICYIDLASCTEVECSPQDHAM